MKIFCDNPRHDASFPRGGCETHNTFRYAQNDGIDLISGCVILGSHVAVVCRAPTFATTRSCTGPVRKEDGNEMR